MAHLQYPEAKNMHLHCSWRGQPGPLTRGPLCSPVSYPTLIKVLFWVLWIDATALWGNWEVLGEFWGETQTRCLVSIWSSSQWTACVQIVNMPFIWRCIVALKVFFFFSWASYFLSCTHSNSYVSYDMLAVMQVSGDNHTQKLIKTLNLWLCHFPLCFTLQLRSRVLLDSFGC